MASELNKKIPSLSSSSFIGLQSYSEAHADIFFGRDTETDDLTRLVKLNTLTIVFGKSGTGKTSLLNAGVFPLLRKNFCLPFRLRLEFDNESPDLVTQIKKVLKQEIDAYGFKVESNPTSETLWEYFHKEPLWKTVTPILVFDQFEEIFTLAKKNPRFGNEELVKFWEELSDLAENSIPKKLTDTFLNNKENIGYNYKTQKVKIVFAFREEYLPEFESITVKIPSIKTSRFRLMPMNGHQAYEVITKTWKENIQPAEAKTIVTYLTKEKDLNNYNLIAIEPSLLSQVCAFIDKERIDAGLQKVSTDLLIKYPKDTILRSIYEETIATSSIALLTDPEKKSRYNALKIFLEEKMITSEGFRTKYSLTGNDEPIRPCVDALKEKYFIRQELNAIELTHDVLAPIIKIDREKRRSEEAGLSERKKARKKAFIIIGIALFSAISFWFFAKNERDKVFSQTIKLKEQLKKDSTELAKKQDSIKIIIREIEKRLRENPPVDPVIKEEVETLVAKLDSINRRNSELKLQNERTKFELSELKSRSDLMLNLPPPQYIENMEIPQDPRDSPEFRYLQNEFESQKRKNEELQFQIKKLEKKIDSLLNEIRKETGKVGFQGRLYYDRDGNDLVKPSNVTIYLIPKNSMNRRIVKNASVYEISCYDKELRSAKGVITATTDNQGNYKFRNLKDDVDEYFLKICTYYGGYYTVNIKNINGNLNLNASPPIKYPVSN